MEPDKKVKVYNFHKRKVEQWDAWETGVPGLVIVRAPVEKLILTITHEASGMAVGSENEPHNRLPLSEMKAFARDAGGGADWTFKLGRSSKKPAPVEVLNVWNKACAEVSPRYAVPPGVDRCGCLDGCEVCGGSGWAMWVREGCGGECCNGECKAHWQPWARPTGLGGKA